jgi:hypothetical protein
MNTFEIPDLTHEQMTALFSRTDPSSIPSEFIEAAKLVTPYGRILYLTGREFQAYINSKPKGFHLGTVELALNLDRFNSDVKLQTQKIISGEIINDDPGYFC